MSRNPKREKEGKRKREEEGLVMSTSIFPPAKKIEGDSSIVRLLPLSLHPSFFFFHLFFVLSRLRFTTEPAGLSKRFVQKEDGGGEF